MPSTVSLHAAAAPRANRTRIRSLDGLRAVAAGAVFVHHAVWPHFEFGRFGVDVFFVLSGYLITGIMARPERQSVVECYVRRLRAIQFLTATSPTMFGLARKPTAVTAATVILPVVALLLAVAVKPKGDRR
jgi:hypothetical protein